MAGMNPGAMNLAHAKGSELAAIAWLRWRLFVNALRTTRGRLELASEILVSIAFAVAGLGGGLGMAAGAYFMIAQGKPQFIALLFWLIFFFWQLFPIMAAAFTTQIDASDLLRFPLTYRSYLLVRLAYGAFDPATALVCLWCFGIFVGAGFAKPIILPWALLVLVVFVLFNILLTQMIFAWVERWLAQRRTREILGVLFLLLMLSFQLIGPAAGRFGRKSRPQTERLVEVVGPVQAILPPGLAADAIAQGIYEQYPTALSSLALLCGFALIIGYGLHVRLLAQYRGENLTEVAAASTVPKDRSLHLGWNLPGVTTQVAAMLEKEILYLLRSGPMLLSLIMPMVMLLVFRFGTMSSASRAMPFFARTPDLAFPIAAAYEILMLSNLIYNNFGGDGAGIQFLYASPVRFRDIVLAKNLAHTGILVLETILAWLAVSLLYRRPSPEITTATLAGLLFMAPINFAVGNLLSIYSPKRIDYSKFGRQRASQLPALISMGVQVALVAMGACAFWMANYFGKLWIATPLLLLLAAISLWVYRVVLNRIDGLALEKRGDLISELCRA